MTKGDRRAAEARVGWGFVLPQVLGVLIFFAVPLGISLGLTFTTWDLIEPSPTFVGLTNWQYVFTDPRVGIVLGNTLRFILFGTLGYLAVALMLALLLNRSGPGVRMYRALFILPFVLSTAGIGTIWRWVLSDKTGPVDQALSAIGIEAPKWLFDPSWAMVAIAVATTWQALGFGMAIYLAGLQDVPPHLYEAARLDGANAWQRFRYVTLPHLAPVMLFLTVTSVIGALQLYDPVVAMTADGFGLTGSAGGPQNSTRTMVLYIYNQMFQYNEAISGMGYASTLAWLLVIVTVGFTAVQWVLFRARPLRRKNDA